MKHKLFLSFFLFGAFGASSQDFDLLSESESQIKIKHSFLEQPTSSITINGQDYLSFKDSYAVTTKELGSPELPVFSESILIPAQGAISISVEPTNYVEFENVLVAPSKGSLKRNIDPSSVGYQFNSAYISNAFYPSQLAWVSEPYIFRDSRGATITISPYQYNPVTKKLRVYTAVIVTVIIDENTTGINELAAHAPKSNVAQSLKSNHYLNAAEAKYSPLEEDGDLLIICDDQFLSTIEPLAEWKVQEGIKTKVAPTSVSGTTDTDIKAYIEAEYATNPDLLYVLLVGDHADVPSHTYGSSGWEDLWSDSYYGMISGSDYYPELFVGRFSGNATQIETMVDRTLEYEKTPASGDWMTRAIGLASNEGDGIGDDGEPDWQHARNIRTKLMDFGYTEVHEFYDGTHSGADASGDPNPGIISPAVNNGIGLFNYTGHGDQNTCVTGNYSSTDVNNATNNGFYPFVISVACNNGTFTSGTCISEEWMRATNASTPSGAIAACGSSILMAWEEPMQTQDEMAELIAESYAGNRKQTLGGLFYNSQLSMLEAYGNSGTAIEVMQTWVMFGDPTTLFRDKVTTDLTSQHWWNVPLATTNIEVSCITEGAVAAIVQNGELLGKAVVTGGTANVTFPALTTNDPLILTVTKQNYKPYQAVITVADGSAGIDGLNAANLTVYPNPASEFISLQWNENTLVDRLLLKDLSGRIVMSEQTNGNNHSIAVGSLTAGMYFVILESGNKTYTQRLIIK